MPSIITVGTRNLAINGCLINLPLMLVTHLIIGAKTTVEATVHVLSILRLPQAIDCGGGLVSLGCKNVCLYG